MKVILTEDISQLGSAGDTVNVKNGYARNFLVPTGKAIQASNQNMKILDHQKRLIQEKLAKIKKEGMSIAEKIENISCTIAKTSGEEDKLFGSVTNGDIQNSLKKEGINIDRKKILLEEPIKKLGIYSIPIKIHQEVTANLKVWVVKE
jgi:large subunit ribosomal protein L9